MISTSSEIGQFGPFFITKEALKNLDDVFNELFNDMKEVRKNELLEKAEISRGFPFNKDKTLDEVYLELHAKEQGEYYKKAVLFLSGDTSVSANNALDCISDKTQIHKKCRLLKYTAKVGMKEIVIKISSTYGKCLVYSTSYIDEELKQKLFQKLEFWVDQYKPSILERGWNRFHNIIFWILNGCYWVIYIAFSMSNKYSALVKKEMRDMLDEGNFTQDNINKLIVNISKIYSDYEPAGYINKSSKTMLYVASTLLLIGIISAVAPKTSIEYGKSAKWITIWKIWIKLILVLIPGSVILPFLLDKFL